MYADDLALTAETLGEVELIFWEWRQAMESVLSCGGGGCRMSNKGQSWGSMEKVEGNIKPSGKQAYSTVPVWKGI